MCAEKETKKTRGCLSFWMFDLDHVITATLGHSFLYLQSSPSDMDIGQKEIVFYRFKSL